MKTRIILTVSAILFFEILPTSCNSPTPRNTGADFNPSFRDIPANLDINDLMHRTFNFFWYESDSITGLWRRRRSAEKN